VRCWFNGARWRLSDTEADPAQVPVTGMLRVLFVSTGGGRVVEEAPMSDAMFDGLWTRIITREVPQVSHSRLPCLLVAGVAI
jgi:hypothetical protein